MAQLRTFHKEELKAKAFENQSTKFSRLELMVNKLQRMLKSAWTNTLHPSISVRLQSRVRGMNLLTNEN